MTRDEFDDMLSSLAAGWARREYKKVAVHFAENMFYSDSLNYSMYDRESLSKFFADDNGREQSCRFHNAVFDEAKQIGAAEYTYEGTFRYHGTVWIQIAEEKILSWREYQHKSEQAWERFWKIDERDSS